MLSGNELVLIVATEKRWFCMIDFQLIHLFFVLILGTQHKPSIESNLKKERKKDEQEKLEFSSFAFYKKQISSCPYEKLSPIILHLIFVFVHLVVRYSRIHIHRHCLSVALLHFNSYGQVTSNLKVKEVIAFKQEYWYL